MPELVIGGAEWRRCVFETQIVRRHSLPSRWSELFMFGQVSR